MAIGGKLLGKVVAGAPVNALAGKAAIGQVAGGQQHDELTAQQIAQMRRSQYHPISMLKKVDGASGQVQMRFAKYGMWASMLAFILPAAKQTLAKGKFDSISEYNALKDAAAEKPEKGAGAIWHTVRVKPHALLAGIENLPQSLTFNKIKAGVDGNEGNLAKGVWAAVQDVMSQSTAESKKLRALQQADEPKKAPDKRGLWERVSDVSGNAQKFKEGLKDTSLLEGVVKVGQVAGTTISTYDTVTGSFKNLKMLQLLHQQTTGQKIGRVRLLLFARNLPEVVQQARKEFIRTYSLAAAVDGLSLGITSYVAKNELGEFNLMNPQTWVVGVGHVLTNIVSPRVKNGAVILTGLRNLNYETPSVDDYAKKVALLHPGIREAGLSADHPILQGLGEHLQKANTPLSSVPGLIQTGWVDAAVKEIAREAGAKVQKTAPQQPDHSVQHQQAQHMPKGGHVAREEARNGGRPIQQGGFRQAVASQQHQGELVGAGRGAS